MTPSSSRLARLGQRLGPLLPGVIGFLVVVGTRPLSPLNVQWIEGADPLKDYLGWSFFRHAPWGLPLGANPTWGMEKLGSSIFYADIIPLLALVFKPFAPVLSEPFQYVGLWLLACFLLQGYFAWRVLTTATTDVAPRVLGALLVVFAPPLLMRVGLHHALVGQWLLVAALSFIWAPPERPIVSWALLAATAALVHPYLLVMVLALWSAAWAGRWLPARREPARLIAEAVIVPAGAVLALWQAGAFMMARGVEREGFAYYRLNLDALVNPAGDAGVVWSRVLPALRGVSPGEYEGFAYLGLGLLVAVVAALGLALLRPDGEARPTLLTRLPLLAVAGILTLAAASTEVSFGSRLLTTYALPDAVVDAMGALRASGRLFWPVFYLVVLASLVRILRALAWRPAVLLLSVLVCAQIVDTSPGWLPRRAQLNAHAGRTFRSPLSDPFWATAGDVYRTLRIVHWRPLRPEWATFAVYAERHRMRTESAYLTRADNDRLAAVKERQVADLDAGRFEAESLYVLDDDLAAALMPRVDASVDRLARIDGFWILAPRWNQLHPPSGR